MKPLVRLRERALERRRRALADYSEAAHARADRRNCRGATTLPEKLGGSRNWDYRYRWIRDSTLTLCTLNAGYRDEAEACGVGRHGCGPSRAAAHRYGISRALAARARAAGSRATRAARRCGGNLVDTQLDVYGELMDVLHAARGFRAALDEAWRMVSVLLAHWRRSRARSRYLGDPRRRARARTRGS
jgi:hypothetical protein